MVICAQKMAICAKKRVVCAKKMVTCALLPTISVSRPYTFSLGNIEIIQSVHQSDSSK